jgi:SRSO17 transposase
MVEAQAAYAKLTELMGRLAGCFARVEPRRAACAYVRGLVADLPRKNCWTLAQHAGDATPDKMQRLLERARWDAGAAMRTVRDFAVAGLGEQDAVVVLDESGQEKKGERTVGVKRQYVGCAGQVTNAINVVYASYTTALGHTLVAARLYLPKEWADDRGRRAAAGVPEDVVFATKPELAVQMLTELHQAGALPPWVTGDEVYGRDRRLREWCEDHGVGYVLGVPCSFRITLPSGRRLRADTASRLVPTGAWSVASCGPGSKGDRDYAWAWLATASPHHHLLVRRSLTDPGDLAFFTCYVPEGRPATLPVLVNIAGRRWPVEEDLQVGKSHFGLADSQVRTYTALHRHITLAMAAAAICATAAAAARSRAPALPPLPTSPEDTPPADPGLIPFTVAEVKRLINLLLQPHHSLQHYLHWSWWRRRHQARARWFHHRTRLQRQTTAA